MDRWVCLRARGLHAEFSWQWGWWYPSPVHLPISEGHGLPTLPCGSWSHGLRSRPRPDNSPFPAGPSASCPDPLPSSTLRSHSSDEAPAGAPAPVPPAWLPSPGDDQAQPSHPPTVSCTPCPSVPEPPPHCGHCGHGVCWDRTPAHPSAQGPIQAEPLGAGPLP